MGQESHAWIDESVHTQGPSPGFYLLAAAIEDSSAAEPTRGLLRRLTTSPTGRLHWNSETSATRQLVTRTIGTLDVNHLVVVTEAENRRQERARRKCLQRLLFELDQRDVTRAWIESRQAAQDRRDQEMVEAMRGTGALHNTLRAHFAKPLDDPMLWIPDAVAGMTLAALRDHNHTWLDHLTGSYELITL